VLRKGKAYPLLREERGNKRVYSRTNEEGIHQTIKVLTDCISILCRKKEWKEKNGTRLLISQQVDSEEQLSTTTYFGHNQEH